MFLGGFFEGRVGGVLLGVGGGGGGRVGGWDCGVFVDGVFRGSGFGVGGIFGVCKRIKVE